MSFSIVSAPQRSPEWMAARLGRLTASRVADAFATLKGGKGEAASRRNLRVQLALERIAGKSQENGYCSPAMQQGIDREADAYAAYEALTGQMLSRTGFLSHDTLMVGASLDGHVGDFEGLIEIKSPLAATHLGYLKTGVVPGDYLKQINHALWITGAQWCDWMSYQPDFPAGLQTKIVRVARDERVLDEHNVLVRAFLDEVDREVAAIAALKE